VHRAQCEIPQNLMALLVAYIVRAERCELEDQFKCFSLFYPILQRIGGEESVQVERNRQPIKAAHLSEIETLPFSG
jgi:hypothetical protein